MNCINGTALPCQHSQSVKFNKILGVIIDENLTWKNHIDAISKTISRNIGILTKLKHYVPEYILYSLYCTLTQSSRNHREVAAHDESFDGTPKLLSDGETR